MLVSILRIGSCKCIWCMKGSEYGLDVEFKDGLSGSLCKKCFWTALRVRAVKDAEKRSTQASGNPK